ncbi:MAG: BatA domain-containing protein [Puniceicoccaceae bacterium]
MSVLFANAVLLPLAALAALPVIIHLVARLRPRTYPFGSLLFIRRAARKTRQWQRPRDWLLLLLRTLLVVFLIGVFLRPVFFAEGGATGTAARRVVVLVVDATASMAYQDGVRSRYGRAVDEASELLANLRSGDRANIVFLRRNPSALLPEASPNLPLLREELLRSRVTHEAGRPADAVAAAVGQLRDSEGRRELIIVSDFQRGTWGDAWPEIPADIRLTLLPVGAGVSDNLAAGPILLEPATPLEGESVTATTRLYNFSPEPRRVEVVFSLGEIRRSTSVALDAWSDRVAVFPFDAPPPGEYPLSVSLPEDAFPADDTSHAVLRVSAGLEVAVPAMPDAPFNPWSRALRAIPSTVPRPPAAEIPRSAAILIWDGPDPRATPPASGFLEAGGTVVWAPSVRSGLPVERLPEPTGYRLARPGDPLFRVFADGAYGNPALGIARRRFRAPPDLPGETETLIAFADGPPALARVPVTGPGALYWWNLPLLEPAGNYANRPEFLAVIGEIAESVRRERPADGGERHPGEPLHRYFDVSVPVGEIAADGPEGAALDLRRRTEAGGDWLTAGPVEAPGIVTWRERNRVLAYDAVAFPLEQSDLRSLPPDEIRRPDAEVLASAVTVRQREEGVEWWPWLLLGAGLLALAEVLVANTAALRPARNAP